MDIRQISNSLYSAKGWMKLSGVLLIINGVFIALTIIGILIAWLPIWMGVLLFQSAGAVERAYNSEDEAALVESLSKLKTYFVIMGVLSLIGIVLAALSFVGGMAGIMAGAGSFSM